MPEPAVRSRGRPGGGRRADLAGAAVLVALVAAVFGQVAGHPFLGLDDTHGIADSPTVLGGLRPAAVLRAFTEVQPPYWHPLTTLSHQAAWAAFGSWAGGHLLVNVALHAGAAVVLLRALLALTGARWPSLATAALFAVHPLRVESVAWVAERKDVLSGLLLALALGAYARYARRPGTRGYAAVAACFVLGMLAKPVVVVLPLLLLVIDFWPLGRCRDVGARRLLLEKAPLLLLALPVAAVTVATSTGSTFAERAFPLGTRLANAAESAVVYLRQAAWPSGLAVFYPHPASVGDTIPAWRWGGALLALAALSLAVALLRRDRPWLAAGWLWYLAALAPVLGIVQHWEQARADRFTYLPLVGVFAALAWEARDRVRARPRRLAPAATLAVAAVIAASAAAHRQAALWREPEAVFRQAVANTDRNWLAESQLGVILLRRGELAAAEGHLSRAVALRPLFPVARNNLGVVYSKTGRTAEAQRQYAEALRQDPGYVTAAVNLGVILLGRGDYRGAADLFRRAASIQPGFAPASLNLGLALEAAGDRPGAAEAFAGALRADPGLAAARAGLARTGGR